MDFEFQKKTPAHVPFCHVCRSRTDLVCILRDVADGNPTHVCESCVDEIKKGFLLKTVDSSTRLFV